jgi:hypothetical protein
MKKEKERKVPLKKKVVAKYIDKNPWDRTATPSPATEISDAAWHTIIDETKRS